MDISDIHKVASRKKINTDATNLREKVSRETAKIIKLKVAQDTAYWDLKERLQQAEGNRERLQQNMVEVQMQHEAISGQYQEELRLRPDTLNKLSSTREICDVLEDYSGRLKDTLSRCKADQAALCEAYQGCGQLVREMKAKQDEERKNSQSIVQGLEEKVKLMNDHQNQLFQFFTQAKEKSDAEINSLRENLTSVNQQKEDLIAAQNELNRKLEQCKFDIERKEEKNLNLQAEIKKLMQEFNGQASEARDILAQQDKVIKEVKEENEAFKKALENQEQFTKTVCEQNNTLNEKIASLEHENSGLQKANGELSGKMEEATNLNQSLQISITTLSEEKQIILQKLQDAQQFIINLEQDIKRLEDKNSKIESEKANIVLELNKAVEESNKRSVEIENLTSLKVKLEEKVEELEAAFKAHREATDEKNKELNSLIEAKDHELDSKSNTITKFMSQLKSSEDGRFRLEGTLQKIKKEIDIERDVVKEKEKKMTDTIGQLEIVVRNKDDELSKQMSIILEMRNEKERLQEKIQSMQNTIDNVQKELTRPPPSPGAPRMQPEQDDNAVMLTPARKKTALLPPPPSTPLPQPAQFTVPRKQEPKLDNMLFNLFSDSSMEGDNTLDASEVNRRFSALARGERVSPMPLSALKRRGSVPAAQTAARKHASATQDAEISLSQVKNDIKNKERSFFKNKRTRK